MSKYMQDTDLYGKIWIWTAVVVVMMVPVAVCLYYNAFCRKYKGFQKMIFKRKNERKMRKEKQERKEKSSKGGYFVGI